MIIAELTHNPYLLITKVKFNGQEPRINSQIEKYENQPLKDWVCKVPGIFYDEMNGYDFDFYFSGTKSDFEEVKNTFISAGVTADQVRIFYKNEIEDTDTKCEEIDNLIKWMRQNPNRQFDFNAFWEVNSELFEASYPYIILNGELDINLEAPVSPETIRGAQELSSTNLKSTPILFIIEKNTTKQFREDLMILLERKDVRQEQLFFLIDSELNRKQVVRVISDLGVNNPKVIERYDDIEVFEYIKNYPVTENIREAIKIFSFEKNRIKDILDEKNKESEITNAEIRAQIDSLEIVLEKLKEADEFFIQRDNYAMPQIFTENLQSLEEKLAKWKNRKTKVMSDKDAENLASDYTSYIDKIMNIFNVSIKEAYQEAGEIISSDFSAIYLNAGVDMSYCSDNVVLKECGSADIPDLTSTLLSLKEITYEEAKTDIFGLFKKVPEENREQVCVVTYYLERWRAKAVEVIRPIAEQIINECFKFLLEYYNALADNYHRHLVELISIKMDEKEEIASGLSDDERHLQEDNDWLRAFNDQLQNIERG